MSKTTSGHPARAADLRGDPRFVDFVDAQILTKSSRVEFFVDDFERFMTVAPSRRQRMPRSQCDRLHFALGLAGGVGDPGLEADFGTRREGANRLALEIHRRDVSEDGIDADDLPQHFESRRVIASPIDIVHVHVVGGVALLERSQQ